MNYSQSVRVRGAEVFNPIKKTDNINFSERIFEIFKDNKQIF